MYGLFFNNLIEQSKINKNEEKENLDNSCISCTPKKQTNKIIKLQSLNFSKQIDAYFKKLKTAGKTTNRKKLAKNNLYIAVCLLQMYDRKAAKKEDDDFSKKMYFAENFLKQNDMEAVFSDNDFQKIFK